MFDLNDKSDERANDETWRDLFVKCVANYLMFPTPAPSDPSAEEALRREAWLEERRGVGELLTSSSAENVIGFDYGRVWREADPFGRRSSAAKAARPMPNLAKPSAARPSTSPRRCGCSIVSPAISR